MAVPSSTITRDLDKIASVTGNIYESVAIMSLRSIQIATNIKEELNNRLADFSYLADSLDEIHENKEQAAISVYFEKLPKPILQAIDEFMNDKVEYRLKEKEDSLV